MNITFGIPFLSKKKDDKKVLKSPITKNVDSDADIVLNTVGSQAYGTFVDFETKFKNNQAQIEKYRELAMMSEVETAIDVIVNESIVVEDDYPVSLVLDNVEEIQDKTKDKIRD